MKNNLIASRISALRQKIGLSQTELATILTNASGNVITTPTISSWETGRRMPPSARMPYLAEILGCTEDYLYGKVDDENGIAPELPDSNESTNDIVYDSLEAKVEGEVKLRVNDIINNRRFDGRPVYITFKNYAHKNQWGLVNLTQKAFILSDRRMLNFDAESIDFIYVDEPSYSSFCSINGNYPLDMTRLMRRTRKVYIEMRTADKNITTQYNGWYSHNENKTCLINSIGLTLPYSGLGISYNAYSGFYKKDRTD